MVTVNGLFGTGYLECKFYNEEYTTVCGYADDWSIYPIQTGIMYYYTMSKEEDGKYFSMTKVGNTILATVYHEKNATDVKRRIGLLLGSKLGEMFECETPREYEFVLKIYDDNECNQDNVVTYYATIKPNSCTQTRSGGKWFEYTANGDVVSIYHFTSPYCSEETMVLYDDYILNTCSAGSVELKNSKYKYVVSKKSGYCYNRRGIGLKKVQEQTVLYNVLQFV